MGQRSGRSVCGCRETWTLGSSRRGRLQVLGSVLVGMLGMGGCFNLGVEIEGPARDDPREEDAGSEPEDRASEPGARNGGAPPVPAEVDKIDLLLVIDNSHSMDAIQLAVIEQLPRLMESLTTGRFDPRSDAEDFRPIADVQVGVVSSDMGLVGIENIPRCGTGTGSRHGDHYGDDGRLIDAPRVLDRGCATRHMPPFLQFQSGDSLTRFSEEVACLARLGADGCGFEQQLEAPLKALAYPGLQADVLGASPNFASNEPGEIGDVVFVGPEGVEWGHGGPDGPNAGFLRDDSLLVIVQVTDEEDCSAWNLSHFSHPQDIAGQTHVNPPPNHLHRNALNLRCFYNKENLYPVKRYVNGLEALRPGMENFIVYAAIVGIVPELIATQPTRWSDDAVREAWYSALLEDPSMSEVVDANTDPLNLHPSCHTVSDTDAAAYPPPRIVEVVRGFGSRGTVQSICDADFGFAFDNILRVIATALE